MNGSPLNAAEVGRVKSTRFFMAARGSLATKTSRDMREMLRSWRMAFAGSPVRGGSEKNLRVCFKRSPADHWQQRLAGIKERCLAIGGWPSLGVRSGADLEK
jgi:hypothetical protein